jgi:hypothetical protein
MLKVCSISIGLVLSEMQGVPILWGDSRVDQAVQGAPKPRSLGGSPASLRPFNLVWSAEDALCGGRGDPPRLEKLLSGGGIKVTNEAW